MEDILGLVVFLAVGAYVFRAPLIKAYNKFTEKK